MTRQLHWKVVLAVWVVLCGVVPVIAADTKPAPKGDVVHRKPLSKEEQIAFLAKRMSSGMMLGSFDGYCSLLYAALDVCIHTQSEEVNRTSLDSPFPDFYKPTWGELFDSIARQTKSSWTYDPKEDFWVFNKPSQPLPFTIEMAKNWKADDRGSYVCYQPKVAPVGMDVYMMGTYSADKRDERQALFNKVRDAIALRFAKTFKKDVTAETMTKTKVGNSEALYFTIAAPDTGIIWRQWVIVDSGKAFCIVSAIKPAQEKDILPDVEAMVKSFKIAKPPVKKPDKPDVGKGLGSLSVATAQESKNAGGKKQITNSIGMKLVLIPAGEFKIGSGESAEDTAAFFNKTYGEDLLNADFFKDEHPQHRVRITKPFYLGTYHVTRGQFRQFVADTSYKTDAEKGEKPGAWGWNPDKKKFGFNEKYSWRNAGFEQTDEHPVVNVSWNDAAAFCKWLSKKEGKTYRLPTEAEWEYACRAGTTTRYYSGDDPETLAKVGNVADAAAKAKFPDWKFTIKANDGYVFTAPVGKFKPNAFGLYDMHGNAWQRCADWYGAEYYAASPADDPTGPDSGEDRVLRGGSWLFGSIFTRSALRTRGRPDDRSDGAGFRVARTQ